ncbi:MAG TPA: NADH-quinone oxidoreductase subunit C [Bacteroidales bacterium]|nr:NADH-quinone oxidoreductase subunit C [Bacteroidales bacterium]HPO65954.1 NADH-quinone oxidoreductase subunit C [Bacteroidales bacterium]
MSQPVEEAIKKIFPELTLTSWAQFPAIEISRDSLLSACEKLTTHPDLRFDMLVCLTAVDRTPRLEVLYHLRSTTHGHELIVKTELDESQLEIPSVVSFWKAAELFELEVYDMFGITFTGHSDLRRLFMPDDWDGYPLRKSYKASEVADNYLKSHQLLIN